ncbi:MAG: glucose-1-phosphate cytidylyltransferase [Gammaproteobacteria bacterium]|nr:glucose-1-phosphate cytidylyltransferase [Gammaproteobacteria bacterium]
MKVVLFCGGLGTRLREQAETIPKPLVTIGFRPLLWHLMRYYAHFGHREFILCLGYRGDLIRDYFLSYREAMNNDFTWRDGGRHVEVHGKDMQGWSVTCVDTGLHSNIGQRLLRVAPYLRGETEFLANYADGLSNLPLDRMIEACRARQAVAGFASVRSPQSFHAVRADSDGMVSALGSLQDTDMRINGGFFVMRSEIFSYLNEGEELVEQPFARLIQAKKLFAYSWDGFWQCMDTFKDKIMYDRMEGKGDCPWKVWQG